MMMMMRRRNERMSEYPYCYKKRYNKNRVQCIECVYVDTCMKYFAS